MHAPARFRLLQALPIDVISIVRVKKNAGRQTTCLRRLSTAKTGPPTPRRRALKSPASLTKRRSRDAAKQKGLPELNGPRAKALQCDQSRTAQRDRYGRQHCGAGGQPPRRSRRRPAPYYWTSSSRWTTHRRACACTRTRVFWTRRGRPARRPTRPRRRTTAWGVLCRSL